MRHTQETPIAQAAAHSVEPHIRRHGAGGAARNSWRDSATVISERLGLDAFPRESFYQGLAPWCCGEGVSFTPDLGTLSGSSDDSNPAARLFAATSALARLPSVDVQLWTDGSVVPGVGTGAGFVIYVNSLLYASEAYPAGLESLDFHAGAVAMCLGLAAFIVLKNTHPYSSIRFLTDCQSLITTLSIGPARQPDSVCISIWSHLSSISKTSSIHILDSISYWHSWQHTGRSGSQAGLHPSSDISSCRSGNGKGPDSEDGAGGVSDPLQTRPAPSHTLHLDWRHQPAGTLEIWLDQKPVHHCCQPLSASGQLLSPYRTTTVSNVSL